MTLFHLSVGFLLISGIVNIYAALIIRRLLDEVSQKDFQIQFLEARTRDLLLRQTTLSEK
jgi:hypothetical protein